MAIKIGAVPLDERHAVVRETYEEAGGRDARQIEISGLVVGEHSPVDIEARLDALIRAASESGAETELSLRAGRRVMGRRVKCVREISRDSNTGRYSLVFEARDPFDEAIAVTALTWLIPGPGASMSLSYGGNLAAPLLMSLLAYEDLVNPGFGDSQATITYVGTVAQGERIVFDGRTKQAWLEGMEVTPYLNGTWPQVHPGGSPLVYMDGGTNSSDAGEAVISYRARWW